MVKYLAGTLEEEQYYCKALRNETVKINVNTSDTYRRLVKRLQEDNIVHHTYQIRDERAYRVVLRNLHHCRGAAGTAVPAAPRQRKVGETV